MPTISTMIRMDIELRDKVDIEAKRNHRSRSNQIARLLEAALANVEQKKEGNENE